MHRLTLHDIIHEAIHYFTHADKGVLGLVKDLATRTGAVAREFVTGKRKKYFPPLNFFLIVGTVYVLIVSLAYPPAQHDVLKDFPQISTIADPVKKQAVIDMVERQYRMMNIISKYSNVVSMIAVPLTCFLFWLCYVKGRYNYTEHLIACLYKTGFTNLTYAVIFIPIGLLVGVAQYSIVVAAIYMAYQIAYYSVFYYRFINHGTTASAWKAFGASVLVTVAWVALSTVLVVFYIKHGFWGLLP